MFIGDWASNDSGVVDNGNFQRFRYLFRYSDTLDMRPALLYGDMQSAFQWSQNAWPWMTLNDYIALNFVFAPVNWLAETVRLRKI